MHLRRALIFVLLVATVRFAFGAEEAAKSAPADFATQFSEMKQLIAKLGQLRERYQTDPAADKKTLEADFNETLQKARAMSGSLNAAAEKAYLAEPNKDKELSDYMLSTIYTYLQSDDYERAAKWSKLLLDNHLESKDLNLLAGLAFFGSNNFEDAGKYLQLAKDAGVINDIGQRDLGMVEGYKQLWAREQKIRADEDKADNLPKVKLTTSKGDIVVELLENEAPIATSNFISLVEKKYYDGTKFHRVLPGFMAQGGDPKGDGTGGPGYTIPCECSQDNHRIHFRGSLSMAHAGKDTGGSQFFLTFAPTSHLDGKHTVFGRVVEGFDVLAKLQRIEPGQPGTPDKIIKATVLRKRNHKYDKFEAVKRLDKAKS